MATWRVNNSTLLGGEVCAQWQANHAYAEGARCVCTTAYGTVARRYYVYECTTAGTSHATTQPTWPTSGTVNDGTVVWTTRIPNDGSWDNATCILHYVLNHSAIAAGDTVYIDDGHSEAVLLGATTSYTLLGSDTKNNPIRILCVDKASDTLSAGAVVADQQTSASYAFHFYGAGYSYGVEYTSATNIQHYSATTMWTLETSPGNKVLTVASAKYFGAATNTEGQITIKGNINIAAADAWIYPLMGFKWLSGSLVAASGVTALFKGANASMMLPVLVANVDLSALGNNYLLDTNTVDAFNVLFTRCKLPAAFTPVTGLFPNRDHSSIRLHHCSSDNATYDFYEENYCGTVRDETTIVRTGGASDGTTPIAMKMVSSANTKEFFGAYLTSTPIHTWTTSAASQTVTVEFVHDSATALQNDEVWLEVEYPADNTSGLGAVATSQCAQLGTPADTTDSSETWTTTGLTNPNTRKLAVTIDPGKVGPITARVCLAKASTTVYVDPLITIT